MALEMENPAGANGGASGNSVHAAKLNITEDNAAQAIRADLIGSTTCTVGNLTGTGHAPVLAMCRELLAAGVDPDQALEFYRGAVLALRVRSIGDGAALTIKTAGNGTPILAKDPAWRGAGAPPVRKSAAPLCGWQGWPAAADEATS
jgi:hypothetical protein